MGRLGTICLLLIPALATSLGQTPPPVSFNARQDFLVGGDPFCFAVGDFNGDGNNDLVVFNTQPNSISILLGNPDGSFKPAVNVASSIYAFAVAVADFNGDGKPDLVVTGGTTPFDVWILLGNGDGTFQTPKTFSVPFFGGGIAVGDFNGDGRVDLAMVGVADPRTQAGEVLILLGNGDGTLQSPNGFSVGTDPRSVAVGDFNGDGKTDLAVASGTLSILLGNGDGTFGAAENLAVGLSNSVVVGDFDGDGKADLAMGGNSGILVLLGKGDGSFQSPKTSSTNASLSLAVGDFNSDGKMDLASIDGSQASVSILLGNGDGTLGPPASLVVVGSVRALAVADVNHDGKADVLTLADVNGSSSAPGSVSVLLGNGDGTFLNTPAPVSSNGLALVEGDFNRDGKADLAAASGSGVVVMLGKGKGTFQSGVSYPVGGTGVTAVSVLAGDFNHDGTIDLAAISQNPGTVSIFLGNSDGTFQAANNVTTGNEPLSFAAADFNGDGKLDLAVLNAGTNCTRGGTSDLVMFLGNGDGTLQVGLVTSLSTVRTILRRVISTGMAKSILFSVMAWSFWVTVMAHSRPNQ